MSQVQKMTKQQEYFFLTLTVIEWIDVFSRKAYRDMILESLTYCRKHKGLKLHAFVIMTNHLHLIVSTTEGILLSDIVRDFKKFSSKKITEAISVIPESRREWMLERFRKAGSENIHNKTVQFWIQDNHPEIIFSEKFLWQKFDYIHFNPVKAGWVYQPQDFVYSSAPFYYGAKHESIIELDPLDIALREIRCA